MGDVISTRGTVSYDSDADGVNDATSGTESGDDNDEITIPAIPTDTGFTGSVGYTSATLTGTLNPAGEATTYYFEYGTSEDYGFSTETRNAGEGTDNVYVSLTAEGLEEGTTYHYRLAVVRNGSVSYGEDAVFTTKSGGTASGEGIRKNDPSIGAWATGYVEPVDYGFLLYDRFRTPEAAVGKADATSSEGFVSLGTRGSIVMTFDRPITDGAGYDFAVFGDSPEDNTLELAYVEVSSDGENFIRFDNESLNPGNTFGATDPSLVRGLAGKYRGGYGTPFDLASLADKPEVRSGKVNPKRITHVRITDIYGGRDKDSQGNIIYDLIYSLDSSRAGFDLDAIGVMNETSCEPGDTDGDGEVTLKDAVIVLKILSGAEGSPAICPGADANGDNRIGSEELLFILRKIAEM